MPNHPDSQQRENPTASIRKNLGWDTVENSESSPEMIAKISGALANGSVGMIKQLFNPNIALEIQHFPTEITVKRKNKRQNDSNSGDGMLSSGIALSDVPGKEINFTLTYTSIDESTVDGKLESVYRGDLPQKATDFFEKMTMPIAPSGKFENIKTSSIPRIAVMVLPHTTRLTKVFTQKEEVTVQQQVSAPPATTDVSCGAPANDTSGQTTPVDVPQGQTVERTKEVNKKVDETKIFGRMQKFYGVIDKIDETRKNFDQQNKHHEVEITVTMTEVGQEQIKKHNEVYSKLLSTKKDAINKAVKNRFVRTKQLEHGKEPSKQQIGQSQEILNKANEAVEALTGFESKLDKATIASLEAVTGLY